MGSLNKLVNFAVVLILFFLSPSVLLSHEFQRTNTLIEWDRSSNIPIFNDSLYSQSYYESLLTNEFHKSVDHEGFSYERLRVNDYGDCILVKFKSPVFNNCHSFILMNPEKQEACHFCAWKASLNKEGMLQLSYNIRGRISHDILNYNYDDAEFEVIDSWREWIDEDKIVKDQIKHLKTTINEDSLSSLEYLCSINAIPDSLSKLLKMSKQQEVDFHNMGRSKLIEYELCSVCNYVQNKFFILSLDSSQNGIYVLNFDKIELDENVVILYYKQRDKLHSIQVGYDSQSERFFRIDAD